MEMQEKPMDSNEPKLDAAKADPKVNQDEEKDHEDSGSERLNDRILKESKKYKSRWQEERARAQEYESKLKEIEQKKMEEQGKYRELADKYKAELETMRNNIVKDRVSNAIASACRDAGCEKPEAMMKLGNKSLLQYDDESGEVHGVDVFVEEMKREYPMLFTAGKSAVINPGAPQKQKPKETDLRKLVKNADSFKELLQKVSKK